MRKRSTRRHTPPAGSLTESYTTGGKLQSLLAYARRDDLTPLLYNLLDYALAANHHTACRAATLTLYDGLQVGFTVEGGAPYQALSHDPSVMTQFAVQAIYNDNALRRLPRDQVRLCRNAELPPLSLALIYAQSSVAMLHSRGHVWQIVSLGGLRTVKHRYVRPMRPDEHERFELRLNFDMVPPEHPTQNDPPSAKDNRDDIMQWLNTLAERAMPAPVVLRHIDLERLQTTMQLYATVAPDLHLTLRDLRYGRHRVVRFPGRPSLYERTRYLVGLQRPAVEVLPPLQFRQETAYIRGRPVQLELLMFVGQGLWSPLQPDTWRNPVLVVNGMLAEQPIESQPLVRPLQSALGSSIERLRQQSRLVHTVVVLWANDDDIIYQTERHPLQAHRDRHYADAWIITSTTLLHPQPYLLEEMVIFPVLVEVLARGLARAHGLPTGPQ